jgi:hypothetical protein
MIGSSIDSVSARDMGTETAAINAIFGMGLEALVEFNAFEMTYKNSKFKI